MSIDIDNCLSEPKHWGAACGAVRPLPRCRLVLRFNPRPGTPSLEVGQWQAVRQRRGAATPRAPSLCTFLATSTPTASYLVALPGSAFPLAGCTAPNPAQASSSYRPGTTTQSP